MRPLSFEQLQKRKLQPKNFLKRKLPATLARRNKNGKKIICDKQSNELNVSRGTAKNKKEKRLLSVTVIRITFKVQEMLIKKLEGINH